MTGWLFGLGGFSVSLLLTEIVRRYAVRGALLDVPNQRSSHSAPTPRGGGIGIVAPVLAFFAWQALRGEAAWMLAGGATAGVAVIGWIDDLHTLPVLPRLAVHCAAAVLLGVAALVLDPAPSAIAAAGLIAWWAFWGVSLINVVNFIDGIDALVGLQALVFGTFALLALAGTDAPGALSATFMGATAAFLLLNRPPARIFLGDVGSGALGVIFGFVGLLTIRHVGWSYVHAFLPLMAIFSDELVTALARLRRGEQLTQAHRSHVYQYLVQAGFGHGRVALAYAGHAVIAAVIALQWPALGAEFVACAGALLIVTLGVMFALSRKYAPQYT